MATITVRNLSNDLIERIKAAAARNGHSMEQEIREMLQQRYLDRREILQRIRTRWDQASAPTAEEVKAWIKADRPEVDSLGF